MTNRRRHSSPAECREEPAADPASRDIAVYVATITSELATMTRAAEFATLAYLLEMARIEAEHQLASLKDSGR